MAKLWWLEKWTGDGASYEQRRCLVTECTSAADARAAVVADTTNAPGAIGAMTRNPIEIEETYPGAIYTATVRWSLFATSGNIANTLAKLVSWDMTGGSQHITQGIANISRTAVGTDTAVDAGGAINLDYEGNVNGTEINSTTFRFTAELVKAKSLVTPSYMSTLYALRDHTNSAAVSIDVYGSAWTFQQRELLFLGSCGQQIDDNNIRLQLYFGASPNGNVTVAGKTIAKKGWEYLWVHYRRDMAGTRVVQSPHTIFVDQVYLDGDFSVI